jgi:hypothetical protein
VTKEKDRQRLLSKMGFNHGRKKYNNNKSKDRRREPYRRMSGGARLHVTKACLLRMVHGISTSRPLCWREICVVLVIKERHIEK